MLLLVIEESMIWFDHWWREIMNINDGKCEYEFEESLYVDLNVKNAGYDVGISLFLYFKWKAQSMRNLSDFMWI